MSGDLPSPTPLVRPFGRMLMPSFREEIAPLTVERLRGLLRYDPATGIFASRERRGPQGVDTIAGSADKNGYVRVMVDRRRYLAHRLAWFYVTGAWPEHQIDHRDGDPRNNALANLRPATPAQNKWNTRRMRNNKSGFKGVCWDAQRQHWRADIRFAGRSYYLGRFDSASAAHTAYVAAANEKFGQFARAE